MNPNFNHRLCQKRQWGESSFFNILWYLITVVGANWRLVSNNFWVRKRCYCGRFRFQEVRYQSDCFTEMNFLIYFVIEADELVSFPQSIMDKTVIDQTNRAVQIFHRPRDHILTYFLVRFHSHKEVVPQLCLTPIQVSVNSRKWMAPCPYIHFAPFQNSTPMLE